MSKVEKENFSLMVCLSPSAGPILVAGGGPVALRKIETLLEGGADVTLVSPSAVPELQALAEEGRIVWVRRTVERKDFEGHRFALLALPRRETESAAALAGMTGCLLNCCAARELGSWSLAAQFRWEEFLIGTGTFGKKPAGAAALKRRLLDWLRKTEPEEEKENHS